MQPTHLFSDIDAHLMADPAPSAYLASLGPALDTPPFHRLAALKTTEQSPKYHPEGSAWNHTLMVVDEAAQRKDQSSHPRGFMWAALLHDIGKPLSTRRRKGRITSYDHDKVGAKLAEELLVQLGQAPDFVAYVRHLVRYHMHILYVVKGLPYADIPGMLERGDVADIALLGLCDRLGRTGADSAAEASTIERFLELCSRHRKD